MIRQLKYKVESSEIYRRVKRSLDGNITSYRKAFIILTCVAIFLLYLGPGILRWMFFSGPTITDPVMRCMDDRLTPYYSQNAEFDANIRHNPSLETERDFIPYVGNGLFGLEIKDDTHFNIKFGRSLKLPVSFNPIVSVVDLTPTERRDATVVNYFNGIVNRFQCYEQSYYVSYEYYAHRNLPSVFVQEIQFTNMQNQPLEIELTQPQINGWSNVETKDLKLQHGSTILDYQTTTGTVEFKDHDSRVIVVSIVSRKTPKNIMLKKRAVTPLEILTVINYSSPVQRRDLNTAKMETEKRAQDLMQKALIEAEHDERGRMHYDFKRRHINVWNNLWSSGFEISTSKAENAINGDRINATIYAVLSNVRGPEMEASVTPKMREDIERALTYADGCYDYHHTLQADSLWIPMRTLDDLNSLVSRWILTLEKQGCYNLLKAGASGVIQAMLLSIGGLRFRNQHLEMNIDPKFLHRDFHFRRLNYGNMTHVNISVSVTEDNKAVLFVALDRSDRTYYACDAGCVDEPVLLGPNRKMFPVKLTQPLTAILYITTDKLHMEELRHTFHLKDIVEAPAHENHVIALHKHGHHLGGLPTLFWVTVCAIIIIFHVFLCKLIVKEYCEPPDKMRYRYSKP